MIDEFIKQARRLFSSKSNGGKQVPILTDQLHKQKQVLLALSIVLLIGYSQFRDHFVCQSVHGIDKKAITNFCLLNGTSTVVSRSGSLENPPPHAGFHFDTNEHEYRLINHNYMRSLWLILILLVICSFVAQRNWANLFQDDVLQALLQLVGSDKSRLVQAAEAAKPYEMLSAFSSNLNRELELRLESNPKFSEMPKSERIARRLELVENHVNIYDHKLDYYPNQMVYLLMTSSAAAYKMSNLNLRRRLIMNALLSSCATILQFLIPLVFIGNEYTFYGLNWACAALNYLRKLAASRGPAAQENSLDYELSSYIFPINTQCNYHATSMSGETDVVTVQCTVGINEICGKLYMMIWWFVVVNIGFELYALVWIILSSLSARTISSAFGLRYWPDARKQADLLAAFRNKRALLQSIDSQLANERRKLDAGSNHLSVSRKSPLNLELSLHLDDKSRHQFEEQQQQQQMLLMRSDERERKLLEAGALEDGLGRKSDKNWSGCSPRRMCRRVGSQVVQTICCMTKRRRRRLEKEPSCDINIYYLLYLLHLRLGKSKSRTEEVIKMTARALENYLAEYEDSQAQFKQQLAVKRHQPGRQNGSSENSSSSTPDNHHQRPIISESVATDDQKTAS